MSNSPRYIVAKANRTAMPFVARLERERDGWIILARTDSYRQACELRDGQTPVDGGAR